MSQPDDANAVRDLRGAEIIGFPPDCVIRRRDLYPDQVVVTHHGETRVYDTPDELYATFRAADPELRRLVAEAGRQRRAWARRHAEAERLLGRIGVGVLLAAVLGGVLLLASL